MKKYVAIAAVLLASLACSGAVEGNLMLDGQPFVAVDCHSGVPNGFTGVDLVDESGRILRLETGADGQAFVRIMPAGLGEAEVIGACGPIRLEATNVTVNGVKNVDGEAFLSCTAGHALSGEVKFKSCND